MEYFIGHIYTAPKLMWLKEHYLTLYNQAYKFLFWEGIVYYLMGCEPITDYSIANSGVKAVAGGHDQCCTALGAGIIKEGIAAYGIGTVIRITPVFSEMPNLLESPLLG